MNPDACLLHTRDERGVHTLTLNTPRSFNVLSEAMLAALQAPSTRWRATRRRGWW